jgi:hypothetical protein
MKQMRLIRTWMHLEDGGDGQAGLDEEARKRIAHKLQDGE